MAAASAKPIVQRLYEEPYVFEFFQAVRLLRRLADDRGILDPRNEFVRFRTLSTLNFPPSVIHDLEPATDELPPRMTVAFLGLTGPSGVLPRHYTELIMRLAREARGEERHALRDWLDAFSNRFITLFYKAWEHYRFVPAFERGDPERSEPDPFTHSLFCLLGLGTRGLRKRLRIVAPATAELHERTLRSINDVGLFYFSGLLAQRHRNAWGMQALLRGYFGEQVEVRQFRGQWLPLALENQTQFTNDGNCTLGVSAVAGDRVWDVQGKILIRLGPLRYPLFSEFLPDRAHFTERKSIFLLSQLIKLYAGAELDADVQLVLAAEDVPQCQLNDDPASGPRLGWNCWTLSSPAAQDADDAVFEAEALVHLGL